MTSDIQTVAVLGTGVLGSQIAYHTAYCGYSVTAYDINDEALDAAHRRLWMLAARYTREVQGATGGRAQSVATRVRRTSDLAEAVRDADLVIEAAPEHIGLKRDLYARLDQVAPPRTIFATNSSTLLPSDLADATGRPDRFLALHFANEIWTHNIAEIMGHPRTDPDVYKRVVAFARGIGMEPVELKTEQPGYVLNSLLGPFVAAALDLLVRDVADPETIDTTWRIATGSPAGPCELLDTIGLMTPYNIDAASADPAGQARAAWLKEHYIDSGKLGRATGEGFYRYPMPADAA